MLFHSLLSRLCIVVSKKKNNLKSTGFIAILSHQYYLHFLASAFISIKAEDETTEETIDGADLTGPYFDANIPNNVTAIVGKSAFLRCKVRNLGNKTVNINKEKNKF